MIKQKTDFVTRIMPTLKDKIRRRLGCTFEEWATRNGYKPDTVRKSLNRWQGRASDRNGYGPRGIALEVLKKLSRETGIIASPSVSHFQDN